MNMAQTLLIPFEEYFDFRPLKTTIIPFFKKALFREQIDEIAQNERSENISRNIYSRNRMCKPFVKWAGGKGALLPQLEQLLPGNFNELHNVTYVEPFVGGGAMLFHMLSTHRNITRAVINDINPDLIHCYEMIAHNPQEIIRQLRILETNYYAVQDRATLFYAYRERFNSPDIHPDERAALFIFLNHTCYNGLYRVNAMGKYIVPHGRYVRPQICNEALIMRNHALLNRVELVICPPGDYKQVLRRLSIYHPNFVYFDPPYRPLINESNFKEYSNVPFNDQQQEELKAFCDRLGARNCMVMISNSDSLNLDGTSYFEQLYEGYDFHRILAPRFINVDPAKRKKRTEVLIRNY